MIAFFSLLASFIFGSNIYSFKDGVSRILDIFLFGGSVVTGIVAFFKLKVLWSKVAVLVWLALIIVSFFTTDFSSTAFEYWAFASLFLALVFDYSNVLDKRLTASI